MKGGNKMEQKSKIDRIETKLDTILGDDKKKKKKFKLPFRARISKSKAKQNYVTVIKINENRNLDFDREKIIDQTIMVDDVPRLASGEYIFNYKNKPVLIQPSWSVTPLSPSKHYSNSLLNGSNSAGYRLLMNRMQGEALKIGKKIGGLGLSIGALVIGSLIIYALITG